MITEKRIKLPYKFFSASFRKSILDCRGVQLVNSDSFLCLILPVTKVCIGIIAGRGFEDIVLPVFRHYHRFNLEQMKG